MREDLIIVLYRCNLVCLFISECFLAAKCSVLRAGWILFMTFRTWLFILVCLLWLCLNTEFYLCMGCSVHLLLLDYFSFVFN